MVTATQSPPPIRTSSLPPPQRARRSNNDLSNKVASIIATKWMRGEDFGGMADAVINAIGVHIATVQYEELDRRIADAIEDHMGTELPETEEHEVAPEETGQQTLFVTQSDVDHAYVPPVSISLSQGWNGGAA